MLQFPQIKFDALARERPRLPFQKGELSAKLTEGIVQAVASLYSFGGASSIPSEPPLAAHLPFGKGEALVRSNLLNLKSGVLGLTKNHIL